MRPSRGAALIAGAVLLAVAVAVAVAMSRRGDETATGGLATTTQARTVAAPPTPAATTGAATGATDPEEPATTTEEPPVGTTAASTTTAPRPYALEPTRRCLQAAGFAVSTIRPTDPRLQALGDLAQRTSLQARRGERTLGLAFGDARLLASLLQVPNDPYRLEVERNAVLMYRPSARSEAAVLRSCLRP